MTFVTDIHTLKGVIRCTLSRRVWNGVDIVYADMWQSEGFLDNSFTSFRACVPLQWDGSKYVIIDKQFKDYNEFWRAVEVILSNTIIINE